MASLRTRLQPALVEIWQRRGPLACLLAPLSVAHWLAYQTRRALYAGGVLRPTRLDVPVVAVGNLYVGGTGKTPLTIGLVDALAALGWSPAIVSRGYGAAGSQARLVRSDDRARDVGDEPLLMHRATGCPVAVANQRVAAAALLRDRHPECDVLIADDALQHWALGRDMEVALLHYRGLGNGWLLPAGPLREPRRRLNELDAVVCNGEVPSIAFSSSRYWMRTRLGVARPLSGTAAAMDLTEIAAAQRDGGLRVLAAAGIGMPDRFFAMLREQGLTIDEMPLADHFDFARDPFADVHADRILITEKDAVKCAASRALVADGRIWVVPLLTEIDPRLVDDVLAHLHRVTGRTCGPSAA